MRKFARSHWKILIAILLAVVLATLALETDSADSAATGPELSTRLQNHVQALASDAPRCAAAGHIASTLQAYGYRPRTQVAEAGGREVRNIEVSVSSTAPGARPERIFIVGAHVDTARGSGTAAVLELARLLKSMHPRRGTEVRFVFFVGAKQSPREGNFIAFVGKLESSAPVRQALAAFKAQPESPAEGLAARAHVMGMTLSDHSGQPGLPALMITDTAFQRYPYFHTTQDAAGQVDYADMARVVQGLARTIASLAGGAST
ncbi:M28 family peptidase [Massilia yuzhufengensis]|uniref:Peptidase M28 domain-containing protein n=1 Tax=Massilia yuzhufengensis TaxID=1164594 RepID=A0A1I1MP58_9BURK|nr:M28 family peptidase [Massilia yuzhufengensis]SFC87169.1 hypothetical protein SAMN05216204_111107 [Massilia yuzhufengensis]